MSLEITVWDVSQGNSVCIKTPNNLVILFDIGKGNNSDENFSPIRQAMNKYSKYKFDEIIISHPHKDHISEICDLSVKYRLRSSSADNLVREKLRENLSDEDRRIFNKYLEICSWNLAVDPSENPHFSSVNGGVDIRCYQSPPITDKNNWNNHSLVIILEYKNLKVLLCGDNEKGSWDSLFTNQGFVSDLEGVKILLASHHGHEIGYYASLFEKFKPEMIIASDGKGTKHFDNRYYDKASGVQINGDTRHCLTTRSDGRIKISYNYNWSNYKIDCIKP